MTRILIVEDNEVNMDLLSRRLERKGYEILKAADGEEALRVINNENPDIVLLDMSLPKLDGWDVARECKKNEATKSIPIIALTAHAMHGDREKAIDAGCDEYETKPLQFQQLLGKIEKFAA